MWHPFESGDTIGRPGSESGIIVRDEEYADGARITIERACRSAPYAITCGIYGWMVHTRFLGNRREATRTFEDMKQARGRIMQVIPLNSYPDGDSKMGNVSEMIQAFGEQYPLVDPPMPFPRARAVMRWMLAAFFVAGGIAHLAVPGVLLSITPGWVPFAPQVIFLTGLFELAAAAALVTRPLRSWAALALALYTICVLPANIKHAVYGIDIPHISSSWWYHGPRLVLQPVLVWWALFSGGVIDWPWRQRH